MDHPQFFNRYLTRFLNRRPASKGRVPLFGTILVLISLVLAWQPLSASALLQTSNGPIVTVNGSTTEARVYAGTRFGINVSNLDPASTFTLQIHNTTTNCTSDLYASTPGLTSGTDGTQYLERLFSDATNRSIRVVQNGVYSNCVFLRFVDSLPTPTPVPPTPTPIPPTPTPPPAPAPTGNATAIIAGTGGSGANCRSGPNGNSNVIITLADGDVVALNGEARNGWQPVLCGGHQGYVAVDFVTEHGDGAQCRAGASDASRLIVVLPQGSSVTLIGEPENGWQPVACDGQNGFVALEHIESGYLIVTGQP